MNDIKEIEQFCIVLLKELESLTYSRLRIAKYIKNNYPEMYSQSEESLEVYLSDLANGKYPEMASLELLNILREIKNTVKRETYDSTILFHYWSEGKTNHKDIDILKVGYISFDFEGLLKNNKDCELIYIGKAPIKCTFKKLQEGNILSISFLNGTAFLIYFDDPNSYEECFYKGAYIASPYEKIACGIGLFEIRREEITAIIEKEIKRLAEENKNEIKEEKFNEDISRERIMAELYKKRFLLGKKSSFDTVYNLKSSQSYNELGAISGYYIRYRKSSSSNKIHGDLIRIEAFGRVIYKGEEKIKIHGRCFMQRHPSPNIKNLIIELYQQNDTEQEGFEFRLPHSFMIFDTQKVLPIIGGYFLKPNRSFRPHASYCILVKTDITEINFNHENFNLGERLPSDYYNFIEKFHDVGDYKDKLIKEFSILSSS